MEFQKVFYKQILGIVMGTNLAPILANIYMAMLEEELKIICKNKNIKWPIMFKRFIDGGFGIMRGNKQKKMLERGLMNLINCAKTFL